MSEKLDELKSRVNEQIKGTRMVGAPTAKELVGFAERTENKVAKIQVASEALDKAILAFYENPCKETKAMVDASRTIMHEVLNEKCEKK